MEKRKKARKRMRAIDESFIMNIRFTVATMLAHLTRETKINKNIYQGDGEGLEGIIIRIAEAKPLASLLYGCAVI